MNDVHFAYVHTYLLNRTRVHPVLIVNMAINLDVEPILMYIHLIIVPCFIVLTFGAILSELLPPLREFALHGKTRLDVSVLVIDDGSMYERWFVEKRCFRHFYIMGLVSFHMVIFFHEKVHNQYARSLFESTQNIVLCGLLWIHLWRRFYECIYVHQWRVGSKMHIAGYMLGMVYYIMLPFVFLDMPQDNINFRYDGNSDDDSNIFLTTTIIWGLICLLSQVQQYQHHYILAAQRKRNSIKRSYFIPCGCWFEFISCPHYLAEILIYISLVVLSHKGGSRKEDEFFTTFSSIVFSQVLPSPARQLIKTLNCMVKFKPEFLLIWVVINLSISAQNSHRWYIKNFKDYPLNRAAIIPFIV